MRKIFLDLGAWDGTSIKYFRKHHDPKGEYEIVAFEPLPENIVKLKELQKEIPFTLIEAAATVYTSSTNFYTGLSQSGSLSDKKRTGGLDGSSHIVVHTIDFVKWLSEFFAPYDPYVPEVIIKMNIEGAEYDIIDHMYWAELIPLVSKFYVQWHWNKIGLSKDEHDRISGMIKSEPWKAMLE